MLYSDYFEDDNQELPSKQKRVHFAEFGTEDDEDSGAYNVQERLVQQDEGNKGRGSGYSSHLASNMAA